jgi:hypothetical protein
MKHMKLSVIMVLSSYPGLTCCLAIFLKKSIYKNILLGLFSIERMRLLAL